MYLTNHMTLSLQACILENYSKQTLEENNFVSLTRKSRRRSLVTNGGHCPNSKQTMMPKRRGEKRQQNEPKETIEKERANEPELQIFIIIRYSWTRQKPIQYTLHKALFIIPWTKRMQFYDS